MTKTNVRFTCNLRLSISGFILTYDERGRYEPTKVLLRVSYEEKYTEKELEVSPEGVAAFTDIPLPEVQSKEFPEQAFTLWVFQKYGDSEGHWYTLIFDKIFKYASMALCIKTLFSCAKSSSPLSLV